MEINPREQNAKLNLKEYTTGKTILESFPTVLFVELTQNCNLNCRMCRSSKGYQKSLNMHEAIFTKLKKELFPFASIVDLRGWGESTILKKFQGYLLESSILVPKIRLVTNALAINRQLWQILMEKRVNVVISVDAASEKTMNLLERGEFSRLIESLNIGTRERDKINKSGVIYFNTVLSSLNLSELPEIVKLAADFGIPRVNLFPVVASRNSPLHLDHRKMEVPICLDIAQKVAQEKGVELRMGASLNEEIVIENGLPDRCSHPWEYCYIDYDGNVGYCDHLIGNKKLMLGSLSEYSFQEIWNSPRFQRLRSLHVQARKGGTNELETVIPHCNWCYKRRYIDFEEETNPEAINRIVSTKHTCSLIGTPDLKLPPCDFISSKHIVRL